MNTPEKNAAAVVVDIHTHLAGVGHGGTNCFIAPAKFNSLFFRLMCWQLGITAADHARRLDQAYLERLDWAITTAAANGALAAVVVFAHDRIYTEAGEPQATGQELFVPNEYVFACAERDAMRGKYMPALSVHPYRRDALDETARWIERGAVAMKWLPNSQGMDPRDKRCVPVFDLLAAKKVPLIVHTAGEHTVNVTRPELGNPEVMLPALDRGVTVVMAHSGTKSGLFDNSFLPQFCALARKYPNCWGDTSAFCTPGRTRWIARFLREEGVVEKLLHGSDYPVPPTAWFALGTLGWKKARELNRIPSLLERDVRVKRALGLPDSVFTSAAKVLAPGSLQRWGVGIDEGDKVGNVVLERAEGQTVEPHSSGGGLRKTQEGL
ncbi:MAG: amidohydrolase family protein [Planctomycetota bacterium]|nr:amidohydrolase family protein [Planctomycetota bacterium]